MTIILSSCYWGFTPLRRGFTFMKNTIILGEGFTLLRRGFKFLKKGGSHLLKCYWRVHTFQRGFKSNNYILYNYLICSKPNLVPTINLLPSHFTCGQLVTVREQYRQCTDRT